MAQTRSQRPTIRTGRAGHRHSDAVLPDSPLVGSLAPEFSLPSSGGGMRSLAEFRGRRVVLYFYPKDDTPGCTIEAKEFSSLLPAFNAAGAVVFGVSRDSVRSHCRFGERHGIGVELLSDKDASVIRSYGCLVHKMLYGKRYLGIRRATFVIDRQGVIASVFPDVTPEGHAREVLAAVRLAP